LIVFTTVTLASSNSALPNDGDYTETCWSCFNINFNTPLFLKKVCISWCKHFDISFVLHKIPRIVTELFGLPVVMCKFDLQRYPVFIMLKCMFSIFPIFDIIPFQRTNNYTKETLQYPVHSNGTQIFEIS
jgi:hypothetical protein